MVCVRAVSMSACPEQVSCNDQGAASAQSRCGCGNARSRSCGESVLGGRYMKAAATRTQSRAHSATSILAKDSSTHSSLFANSHGLVVRHSAARAPPQPGATAGRSAVRALRERVREGGAPAAAQRQQHGKGRGASRPPWQDSLDPQRQRSAGLLLLLLLAPRPQVHCDCSLAETRESFAYIADEDVR